MNNYYVIEIQTNADGNSGNIVTGYADKLTAEDAFHFAITSANDSTVMIHTLLFIDNRGRNVEEPKCYVHPQAQPAQEEETPGE